MQLLTLSGPRPLSATSKAPEAITSRHEKGQRGGGVVYLPSRFENGSFLRQIEQGINSEIPHINKGG
eukprot:1393722-Amorphochlora_amoeboformis.AAC.2